MSAYLPRWPVTQRATWSATAAHLTACYRAPLDDGRRDGLAPKNVRNIHGVLHAALRDAVRWGYLPRNVAVAADLPSGEVAGLRWPDGRPIHPRTLLQVV
jgi:hypothetical protein